MNRYLDLNHQRKIVEEYLPKDVVEELKSVTDQSKGSDDPNNAGRDGEPPKKKQKIKGRNKQVLYYKICQCL